MTKEILFSIFKISDINDLPKAIEGIIFTEDRDFVYRQLLEANGYDVSFDWFQDIYEKELSQRNQHKQDFTPNQLGLLASSLVGNKDGSTYEPTAGNGSMLIADWWRKATLHIPFDFYPSNNPIECWELSDRSLPILLLNLSIRGMIGIVHHGDVLTKEEKGRYLLTNKEDDCLSFSKIVKLL